MLACDQSQSSCTDKSNQDHILWSLDCKRERNEMNVLMTAPVCTWEVIVQMIDLATAKIKLLIFKR